MSKFQTLFGCVLILYSPTCGTLVAVTPEEVVLKPQELDGPNPLVDARIHFPRLGFVVKPLEQAKL